jgi:hypothetical protein
MFLGAAEVVVMILGAAEVEVVVMFLGAAEVVVVMFLGAAEVEVVEVVTHLLMFLLMVLERVAVLLEFVAAVCESTSGHKESNRLCPRLDFRCLAKALGSAC